MSFFRRPRTAAARRSASAAHADRRVDGADGGSFIGVRLRATRGLPTAWDDAQVAARGDRSWKRHRAVQWR